MVSLYDASADMSTVHGRVTSSQVRHGILTHREDQGQRNQLGSPCHCRHRHAVCQPPRFRKHLQQHLTIPQNVSFLCEGVKFKKCLHCFAPCQCIQRKLALAAWPPGGLQQNSSSTWKLLPNGKLVTLRMLDFSDLKRSLPS